MRHLMGMAVVLMLTGCSPAATTSQSPEPEFCVLVSGLHQARDRLEASLAAARVDRPEAAATAAQEARDIAHNVSQRLSKIPKPSPGRDDLWLGIGSTTILIDQVGIAFTGLGGSPSPEEIVRTGNEALPKVDESRGFLDELATEREGTAC